MHVLIELSIEFLLEFSVEFSAEFIVELLDWTDLKYWEGGGGGGFLGRVNILVFPK